MLIGAGDKIALFIEIHPVGAARRIQKNRQFAIGIILPYPVVGLVGEEDIATPVYRGAFGKTKLARHQYRDCTGGNYAIAGNAGIAAGAAGTIARDEQ